MAFGKDLICMYNIKARVNLKAKFRHLLCRVSAYISESVYALSLPSLV